MTLSERLDLKKKVESAARTIQREGLIGTGRILWQFPWSILGMSSMGYRIEYEIQKKYYRLKYGQAAPDAYNLLSIDPSSVEYIIRPKITGGCWSGPGTYIVDGNWDKPINDDPDHYLISFEKYWLYQFTLQVHTSGDVDDVIHSFDVSNKRLRNQFEKICDICQKIECNGYQKQQSFSEYYEWPLFPEYDEVVVCIGRHGNFIFNDRGTHRLIVSRILGLDSIPVRVIVRHKLWQNIRQNVSNKGPGFLDTKDGISAEHPDLQDVL